MRYDIWATQAVEELKKLADIVDEHLPQITVPTLLLHSEGDTTVLLENRDHIRERLGSEVVEAHTYQKSGHILTQDSEYEDVLRRTWAFIKRSAGREDG